MLFTTQTTAVQSTVTIQHPCFDRKVLKLVHKRFSNRSGKPGKNVFRDRRMEFRIGIIKKLIGNLGPNFSDESVKQVNHMVDIKEELYNTTRLSHGVTIRSGRHVPRSDAKDFKLLVDNLTKTEAHMAARPTQGAAKKGTRGKAPGRGAGLWRLASYSQSLQLVGSF